jgi:hypothetical protein
VALGNIFSLVIIPIVLYFLFLWEFKSLFYDRRRTDLS